MGRCGFFAVLMEWYYFRPTLAEAISRVVSLSHHQNFRTDAHSCFLSSCCIIIEVSLLQLMNLSLWIFVSMHFFLSGTALPWLFIFFFLCQVYICRHREAGYSAYCNLTYSKSVAGKCSIYGSHLRLEHQLVEFTLVFPRTAALQDVIDVRWATATSAQIAKLKPKSFVSTTLLNSKYTESLSSRNVEIWE